MKLLAFIIMETCFKELDRNPMVKLNVVMAHYHMFNFPSTLTEYIVQGGTDLVKNNYLSLARDQRVNYRFLHLGDKGVPPYKAFRKRTYEN